VQQPYLFLGKNIMFVLVGSRAVSNLQRKPNDWDFFADSDEVKEWYDKNKHIIVSMRFKKEPDRYLCRLVDGEKASFDVDDRSAKSFRLINNKSASQISDPPGVFYGSGFLIADPLHLMLIKRSHLTVPNNWRKHIEDYFFIKNQVTRFPTTEEKEAYDLRLEEVASRNPTPKINLNMDNRDFFGRSDKAVKRYFEHDDIHRAIKYYDQPLYDQFKTDRTKAYMSRKLFEAASLTNQLRTVREEAYAIALERYIIPMIIGIDGLDEIVDLFRLGMDYKTILEDRYLLALERICTTLTKGWFRDFAIDHYPDLKQPEINYAKKFCAAVNNGEIKPK
jgi:hypothetical protein